MSTFMKYIAIFITLVCAIQTYFYWDTIAGYAFLIALCGWLPACFEHHKV